jgi:ribosomal protein L24E
VGEQGRTDDTTPKVAQCTYCGRAFVPNQGVGRPGKYCRRSCRQRAFEMRRHAGDQAWSDARLIVMAERLAAHEDAIDRVRELVDELRADAADDLQVDLTSVVDRLEASVAVEEG